MKFKSLSLFVLLSLVVVGGFFFKADTALASCGTYDYAKNPTISSISPTGAYPDPGSISISIQGTKSYFCAGFDPEKNSGFGVEERGTSVSYVITNSVGTQMFSGSWSATGVSPSFTISNSVDASSWPEGNYTITATAYNTTSNPLPYFDEFDNYYGNPQDREGNPVAPVVNSSNFTITRTPVTPPTGWFISAIAMEIPAGSSSSSALIRWSTSDLIEGVTTQVTHNNPDGTHVSYLTRRLTNLSVPNINYGDTTFYLYHNGVELDHVTVNTNCVSGSAWDGDSCVSVPVVTVSASPASVAYNGSSTISWSAPTATSCTYNGSPVAAPSGSFSTGALTATTLYTIYCNNAAGTGNGNTSVSVAGEMNGQFTSGPSSCTVDSGQSSCTGVSINWSTTNPVAISAVTNSGGATPNPASGNSGPASFTIPFNDDGNGDNNGLGVTFFLSNNGFQLDSKTVTTTCASNTTWNGSICSGNTVPTVTSPTDTSVDYYGATLGATVTSLGTPASISARGVCYSSTSRDPSFATTNTVCAPATLSQAVPGTFVVVITGLTPDDSYFYRGYATNSTGTGYSSEGYFDTTPLTTWGALTATNCTVANNASSCNTSLSASILNPNGTSEITTPTSITVGTGTGTGTQSINTTYAINPGTSRTFYLYNNYQLLGTPVTPVASCLPGSNYVSGFCKAQVTITASAGANGSISPSGTTSVTYGSSGHAYTITANPGYIANVSINGGDGGQISSYTFDNVTSNQTISATFTATSCSNGATNPPTCDDCPIGSIIIGGVCTPITVSVTASTPYDTTPDTNINFAYTPTTNYATTSCRLLDNNQIPLTVYRANNPIAYNSPNSISGPFTYYVQCKNTAIVSATGISNPITVNTSCPANTTWNGTICAANPTPTGSLSASSCTIASGASTCNSTITWNTTNPISGAETEVNRNPVNPINGTSVISTALSGTASVPVSYATTYFFLYHNGPELAQDHVTPGVEITCEENTTWMNGVCTPNTYTVSASAVGSGTISPSSQTVTHGNTTTFTITPNAGNTFSIGGTCPPGSPVSGSSGATYTTGAVTADCSVVVTFTSGPSGTLFASPCTIANGASTCTTTLTVTTANLVSPNGSNTAITRNPAGTCTNCTYPFTAPVTAVVGYDITNFFLYHNGEILAQDSMTPGVEINCLSGSEWDGDTCEPIVNPSGTIGATNCTIAIGAPSCNSTVSWTTANLTAGATEITRNSGTPSPLPALSPLAGGSQNVTLGYGISGVTTFFLYHNIAGTPTLLAQTNGSAGVATCAVGSTWNGTICAGDTSPSGTIGATNCTIAIGGSSCNASVSWTTANLTGNPTTITRNTGTPASFTPSPLAVGSQTVTLGYGINGTTTFYLYHNSVLLDQTDAGTAVATCAVGSTWNGTICVGDTNPSGTLSASPCTIANGASTCTTTLTVTTANLISPNGSNTAITRNPAGTCTNCTYPFTAPVTAVVSYTANNFFLYHNAVELATASLTPGIHINCLPGSGWDGDSCEVIVGMSGTLSGPNCSINEGENSCTTTLDWGITNPEGETTAITANGMEDIIVSPSGKTNPTSGTASVTVPFNSRTFYLYNNAKSLVPFPPNGVGVTISANCEAGTVWNGFSQCVSGVNPTNGICATPPNGGSYTTAPLGPLCSAGTANPSALSGKGDWNWTCEGSDGGSNDSCSATQAPVGCASLNAAPTTIYTGGSTKLTWSSCAKSCSGTNFDTGGEANNSTGVSVSPAVSTTYVISCNDKSNSTSSINVIVKKKPILLEN